MARVTWAAMLASTQIAREYGPHAWFDGCEYDTGEWFTRVVDPKVDEFGDDLEIMPGLSAPSRAEWDALRLEVAKYGMANAYLQAIPPTGSISYINHSTSSIHPVASGVEIRKEGKLGRVYYPQPHLTNENAALFQSASTIGYEKLIDTYAVSQHWVDQGQSLTIFVPDTATTRDLDRARIYAWRKGCKGIYYIRIQQPAMTGTAVEGTAAGFCESCAL
jgi:ribonucleoside-diphosphate reductase alpha chain